MRLRGQGVPATTSPSGVLSVQKDFLVLLPIEVQKTQTNKHKKLNQYQSNNNNNNQPTHPTKKTKPHQKPNPKQTKPKPQMKPKQQYNNKNPTEHFHEQRGRLVRALSVGVGSEQPGPLSELGYHRGDMRRKRSECQARRWAWACCRL